MTLWGEDHADAVDDIGRWRIAFAVVMLLAYLTSGLWLPRFDAALVAVERAREAHIQETDR